MVPDFNFAFLAVAKIFFLVGLGIYIVFAAVVVRQVGLMTDTVEVGFEGIIKLIAWVHLLFAIFVFLTAFIVL